MVRRQQGIHTDNLKRQLGIDGANAKFDDGNPVWVTANFDAEEEAYEEDLMRIDDEYNFEHINIRGQDMRKIDGLESKAGLRQANDAAKVRARNVSDVPICSTYTELKVIRHISTLPISNGGLSYSMN
jgi:hypothetical protein